MTEEENLSIEIKKLIDDFYSLDVVKKYLALKSEVESDSHLVSIKKEREDIQKNLKNITGEDKIKAMDLARSLFAEYENDPLVINYKSAKDEVVSLLNALKL